MVHRNNLQYQVSCLARTFSANIITFFFFYYPSLLLFALLYPHSLLFCFPFILYLSLFILPFILNICILYSLFFLLFLFFTLYYVGRGSFLHFIIYESQYTERTETGDGRVEDILYFRAELAWFNND